MSKTAKAAQTATVDTSRIVEFPAFDTSKATDQLRAFAEKGMEQSKEAYERLRSGSEDVQKAFEKTFDTTRDAVSELSLSLVAAGRSNAEAGFSHLESLFSAKSLSEVFELQTAFIRQNAETAVNQSRDFQGAFSKAATKLAEPAKDAVAKALAGFKAA